MQSNALVGRVAELGSLGGIEHRAKNPTMKTIYVALLAVLHLCFSAHAADTGTTTNQTRKPIALLDTLAKKIDKPEFTKWVSEYRQEVLAWQAETEKKGTNHPVLMSPAALYVTTSILEQALGKPERVSTEDMPGLFDLTGRTARGHVSWYGPVGFCFPKNHTGAIQELMMLQYRPK